MSKINEYCESICSSQDPSLSLENLKSFIHYIAYNSTLIAESDIYRLENVIEHSLHQPILHVTLLDLLCELLSLQNQKIEFQISTKINTILRKINSQVS